MPDAAAGWRRSGGVEVRYSALGSSLTTIQQRQSTFRHLDGGSGGVVIESMIEPLVHEQFHTRRRTMRVVTAAWKGALLLVIVAGLAAAVQSDDKEKTSDGKP